jgi:hypothetical protein
MSRGFCLYKERAYTVIYKGGNSMSENEEQFEQLPPDVDDDALDDSVSALLGQDIPEVELPDYDPDEAEFDDEFLKDDANADK